MPPSWWREAVGASWTCNSNHSSTHTSGCFGLVLASQGRMRPVPPGGCDFFRIYDLPHSLFRFPPPEPAAAADAFSRGQKFPVGAYIEFFVRASWRRGAVVLAASAKRTLYEWVAALADGTDLSGPFGAISTASLSSAEDVVDPEETRWSTAVFEDFSQFRPAEADQEQSHVPLYYLIQDTFARLHVCCAARVRPMFYWSGTEGWEVTLNVQSQ